MTQGTGKPPLWFWIVSGVCFVWNLMGAVAFVMQMAMSPETLATLPEAERALYETLPAWATAAFAAAVFGGTLGCLGLLLKKAWAVPMFVVSLVGVLVQMGHSFFMSNSFEVYGPGAMVMPIMVIIIAFLLVYLARVANEKGWLSR